MKKEFVIIHCKYVYIKSTFNVIILYCLFQKKKEKEKKKLSETWSIKENGLAEELSKKMKFMWTPDTGIVWHNCSSQASQRDARKSSRKSIAVKNIAASQCISAKTKLTIYQKQAVKLGEVEGEFDDEE
jgi:hypothetical protein